MPRLYDQDLLQEASGLYGAKSALRLFDELAEWQDIANSILLPSDPEKRLTMGFAEDPGIIYEAGSYNKKYGVEITLPQKLSTCIFERIPHFWVHELAHARRQKVADKDGWEIDNWNIFHAVINEGGACFTEQSILGSMIVSNVYERRDTIAPKLRQKVNDWVCELIYDDPLKRRGNVTLAAYKDYIKGPPGFRNRGHVIGHYMVSLVAESESLSHEEVLTLPNDDYRAILKSINVA